MKNEDWMTTRELYRSMLRSDAEPNESPIWVQQLSSADGDIVKEAFSEQDQMGGWEVGLDFTQEGGEKFATSQEIRSNVRFDYRIPEGLQSFWTISWKAPTVKQRIDGGSAVISGNFSYREAKLLSDILNNPLSVP